MDKQNPRACGSERANHAVEIDEPAVGVFQRVGNQRDVLQSARKSNNGLAGFGHENFVVRIAKQPEKT